MQIMIDYDFGDVVLVLFPFTDQTSVKKRPAIVVSSKKYNLERPDVVLMPATGRRDISVYFGDVMVVSWKEAGFLNPSVIKPVFSSLEKGLILRKLG
ncbi:MAG: type II toxin-antitoxin system PemK/MazF family toxin, partial [Desulfobacteraceae bacterium]